MKTATRLPRLFEPGWTRATPDRSQELARAGHAPDGRKRLRRFSAREICRYLIPVAPAHFRRVLKARQDLPQGIGEGNARFFTLEDVMALREHFATEGAAHRAYRPWRPEGAGAKVVAIANFKGGVGKTSCCARLAMSAALDGYRVLCVDLDSQGSLTSILGGQVADEWQTAFPLLARDFARALEAENRVREAAGGAAHALDETLTEAPQVSPRNLVQRTYWPNIDLIGAQLDLCRAGSGLGHAAPLLAALGRAPPTSSRGTGFCGATTSCSSIRRRRSGT